MEARKRKVSNDASGKGTSTSAEDKSHGGWGNRWQGWFVRFCHFCSYPTSS
ncbi:unnamed protein product [Lupinus luteus]|uniref:Uncharacterized protein n=1 Tax=Lupinus luteus TaxID=3873 RepID=A0AAV1WAN6_LUPLU